MNARVRASRLFACVCLAWLAAIVPATAATRAWLDRNSVGAGESVTLNIQTDQGDVSSPDYGPLQFEFDVSGNSSSRSFELVNGKASTKVLFGVVLQPKHTGTLAIPALQVGNERTAPLTLQVTGQAALPARAGDPVFVESQIDGSTAYVQQTLGYVVRLYYDSASPLVSGALDQDPPNGATLQQVGDDRQYMRTMAGRRYVVVERRFVLIPEQSGALAIPGARFTGQTVGSVFDDVFGDGRRELRSTGPARVIDVKPIPANAPQPWLPLRGLRLQYVTVPRGARAGDAATVVVQMDVDGANGTQAPALTLDAGGGAQVFAEPPQVDESFAGARPQVRIVRRFSIVPAQAGTLRIPGPRVQWWDVAAGAVRTTSLADITLSVAPGSGATTAGSQASTQAASDGAGATTAGGALSLLRRFAPWALVALAFAVLWLVTLWWALHRKARAANATAPAPLPQAPDSSVAGAPAPSASASAPATLPDLKRALDSGDLSVIETVLCALTQPAASGLDAVRERLQDPAQIAAVDALQRARWRGGDIDAARSAMREAFRNGPRWRAQPVATKSPLPPLYPDH